MSKDRVSFFRSWAAWYLFVLLVLLALIGFFWYLTKRYA